MSSETPSLEAQLRGLRAVAIDEDLLQRLEACADGTLCQLNSAELLFEARLRVAKPAKLDPAFLAGLESVVSGIPFPMDEKIVLFPKPNLAPKGKQTRSWWSAAAAVALMGAATALLVPNHRPDQPAVAYTPPASGNILPTASSPEVVPTSFNRNVSEVNDEGYVWKGGNQPHSVVRVVYKDKITVKDSNGRTYQVERPRVQYMIVPAKTD